MVKKKGGRYTLPKQAACNRRSGHAGKLLPHLYTSREHMAPRTNDTKVIADMERGEPGPWKALCSWRLKEKP